MSALSPEFSFVDTQDKTQELLSLDSSVIDMESKYPPESNMAPSSSSPADALLPPAAPTLPILELVVPREPRARSHGKPLPPLTQPLLDARVVAMYKEINEKLREIQGQIYPRLGGRGADDGGSILQKLQAEIKGMSAEISKELAEKDEALIKRLVQDEITTVWYSRKQDQEAMKSSMAATKASIEESIEGRLIQAIKAYEERESTSFNERMDRLHKKLSAIQESICDLTALRKSNVHSSSNSSSPAQPAPLPPLPHNAVFHSSLFPTFTTKRLPIASAHHLAAASNAGSSAPTTTPPPKKHVSPVAAPPPPVLPVSRAPTPEQQLVANILPHLNALAMLANVAKNKRKGAADETEESKESTPPKRKRAPNFDPNIVQIVHSDDDDEATDDDDGSSNDDDGSSNRQPEAIVLDGDENEGADSSSSSSSKKKDRKKRFIPPGIYHFSALKSVLPPDGGKYKQIEAFESLFYYGVPQASGGAAKLNSNAWIVLSKVNGFMAEYGVNRDPETGGIPKNLFSHVRQHRKKECVPLSADDLRNHKLKGLLFLVEEDGRTTRVRFNK